jgi:GTP diphosphokinase / guanosine-3',5'-bis(diphosphate) 3'-diphosphatase
MTMSQDSALSSVIDALAFAADKHRDQRRKDKGASPYINHPVALAHILAIEGGIADPIAIAGALLHDTIEDTETTYEELVERFGKSTADVVMECTDDKSLPKGERKELQVAHAPHMSHAAKLVKLADKIANLRDVASHPPADWTRARRSEYAIWARRVVAGLGPINPALEASFAKAFADVIASASEHRLS